MGKQKYKLFNPNTTTAGMPKPPCAFFFSAKGCKNGDKCKFSHEPPAGQATPPVCNVVPPPSTKNVNNSGNVSSDSSSVVSSEQSDNGGDDNMFGSKPIAPSPRNRSNNNKNKSKAPPAKKRRRDEDPFADPFSDPNSPAKVKPSTTPPPKQNPPKKKKKTKPPPVAPAAKTVALPPVPQSAPPTPVPDFRSLNLPITNFSCYDPTTNSNTTPTTTPTPTTPTTPTPTTPTLPIPHSTPEGLKWQAAVLATRAHPSYESTFDFSKLRTLTAKYHPESPWITARPFGEWCRTNPHVVALDFEMCETRNPLNGRTNPKALCRVSIVDASVPDGPVLLDTLVKPDWPVTDHRTKINGIDKTHLENVTFTLAHAQAFMTALCSSETVIIGHALQNDLSAIQMEHHCVVDSACLFSVQDEPNATCSLKDLGMAILKREMPQTHDSVNDARVALKCLEVGCLPLLQNGAAVPPITRTFPPRHRGGKAELFVHRIPKGCKPVHIEGMFLTHSHVKPKEVPEIEFNDKGTGKVTVRFSSEAHGRLAFKALAGESREDMTGRPQKRVYMKGGGYVQVRMMSRLKKEEDGSSSDGE